MLTSSKDFSSEFVKKISLPENNSNYIPCFHFISGALKAQQNKKDYPRTAVYVEARERNFLFGVEADFLITKKMN